MPSPPLDSTHGQQHRAWHDIAAFGQHTRLDVRRDMPSPPLDNTHGRTTSGVACHHRLWAAQTVERRQAWHAIIALGRQTPSTASGVACHHRLWAAEMVEQCQAWHAIIALGRQTRSNDVRRDMPSPPLDSRHGRTTSSVELHYCLWATHAVERHVEWHAIIAFGQHKRSNVVGHGMPSSPLVSSHGRTTSGVA